MIKKLNTRYCIKCTNYTSPFNGEYYYYLVDLNEDKHKGGKELMHVISRDKVAPDALVIELCRLITKR